MRNIKPQAYKATMSLCTDILMKKWDEVTCKKTSKKIQLMYSVWADATNNACIFSKDLTLFVDQWRKELYELLFLKLLS